MNLHVTVQGVDELLAKATPELVQPELDQVLTEVGDELSTPKGGGIGVEVNSLLFTVSSGMAAVESSLFWPRTTGESWAQRTIEDFEAVAPAALDRAGERIAANFEA